MKLIAGFLLATLAAGSNGPGFPELVPQIVSTARAHAVSSSRPGSVAGPVLVDAASFAAAGQSLGESVSAQAVLRGAGQGARAVAGNAGVACTTANTRRRCQVQDRGVIVSVQSATRTAAGLDVVVTTRWTDRRPSGASAVAGHTIRLSYVKQGQAWKLNRKTILRQG